MSYYNSRNSYGSYNRFYRRDDGQNPTWAKKRKRGPPIRSPKGEPVLSPGGRPFASSSSFNTSQNDARFDSFRARGDHYLTYDEMPSFYESFEYADREQTNRPSWAWQRYYQNCKNWHDKHKLGYYRARCMAVEFENNLLLEQIKSLVDENSSFAEERGEMPSMTIPELSDRKTSMGAAKGGATSKKPETKEKERKQEALDKKKAEEELKKKEGARKQDPKAAGLQKDEDHKLLYGENAVLIQKLETALQLSFNRSCDTTKPEMWMAVPLNPNNVVVD